MRTHAQHIRGCMRAPAFIDSRARMDRTEPPRMCTPPPIRAHYVRVTRSPMHRNECPPALHSDAFLADVRCLLSPGGVVVHNLHFGSRALDGRLEQAHRSYARAFGSCRVVHSMDSRPWAGNALIGATLATGVFNDENALCSAAYAAQKQYGLPFDLGARCTARCR